MKTVRIKNTLAVVTNKWRCVLQMNEHWERLMAEEHIFEIIGAYSF